MAIHRPGNLWFDPQSLHRKVAAGPLERGTALYRTQKVLSLDIEPLKDHWLLLGEVQGTEREPYEVSVTLKLTPEGRVHEWNSECSCPVGYQCKHGAALTLKAAYQGLQLLGSEASAVHPVAPPTPGELEATRKSHQARVEELKRLEAEAQLLDWLESLDRAGGQASDGDAARTRVTPYWARRRCSARFRSEISMNVTTPPIFSPSRITG